jgi:hypothetical protein
MKLLLFFLLNYRIEACKYGYAEINLREISSLSLGSFVRKELKGTIFTNVESEDKTKK